MRRYLLWLVLAAALLAVPALAQAQPAFHTGAYCGDNATTGVSYNCPVNPNVTGGAGAVLYVGVQGDQGASDLNTNCTFNGSGMQSVGAFQGSTALTRWIHVWRMIAPAAGAHTLNCTSSGVNTYMQVSWLEYTGACGTQEDVSYATDYLASTLTFQGHITPTNSNTRIISFIRDDSNAGPILASAGNTKRVDDTDWDSFAWLELNAAATGGVAQTVQGVATTAVSAPYAAITLAIRDATTGCSVGATGNGLLGLLGVGN